jgi:hypothetical protein
MNKAEKIQKLRERLKKFLKGRDETSKDVRKLINKRKRNQKFKTREH